jgi:predicted DNA-binding protein (UPF0251 family)
MARPPKERRVEYVPEIRLFKPAGIPKKKINEIRLTLEEVEAIRLKDQEGLTQQKCSERMEISRPTFQRVLTGAHKKIADALIDGKALRFEGGDYRLAEKNYNCPECEKKFKRPDAWGRKRRQRGRGVKCPKCGGEESKDKNPG